MALASQELPGNRRKTSSVHHQHPSRQLEHPSTRLEHPSTQLEHPSIHQAELCKGPSTQSIPAPNNWSTPALANQSIPVLCQPELSECPTNCSIPVPH